MNKTLIHNNSVFVTTFIVDDVPPLAGCSLTTEVANIGRTHFSGDLDMEKNTRVMDIIIFGTCLFIALLLFEYRAEVNSNVRWAVTIPLVVIGLFFGFRAANPDIVRGQKED